MERKGERGLSSELADKFPYLIVKSLVYAFYAFCSLKMDKDMDKHCLQVAPGGCIDSRSRLSENRTELEEIYSSHPIPIGCQACPVNKTSGVKL